MAKAVHAKNGERVPIRASPTASHDAPLQSHDDLEGWTSFDEPIYYIYAGKGPYVGR
jgi:sphingosine kinase